MNISISFTFYYNKSKFEGQSLCTVLKGLFDMDLSVLFYCFLFIPFSAWLHILHEEG